MWHDTRGWEGHVDARWCLRHRAVFNVGMSQCDWDQRISVAFLWVVGLCLEFSWCVGCSLYPMCSQFMYGFGAGCIISIG